MAVFQDKVRDHYCIKQRLTDTLTSGAADTGALQTFQITGQSLRAGGMSNGAFCLHV
ncbi:hypothetical protein Z946_1229 [Sulfitobacter noctilucicola]|nr:hypothetical protein Z946_1229 [Sulfitobacter noctilucicola]